MTQSTPPAVVDVADSAALPEVLAANGITTDRPVPVCVGGAGGMSDDDGAAIEGLLHNLIAPAVDRWRAAVVDGGTDSGVMRMMGQARRAGGCEFPLIGVAAAGTLRERGVVDSTGDRAEVEPHHTLVLRVPGDQWGDETPWLSAVAGLIAGKQPSVTVLINGGRIALSDAQMSLDAGRPLVVVAGSGRGADEIARASGGLASEEPVASIAASPLTRIVDIHDPPSVLDAIASVLQ